MRHRKPSGRTWYRPGLMLIAAVFILAGGAVAATRLLARAAPSPPGSCESLVVPAYFTAAYWAQASATRPAPADLILDLPNGVGAGVAADPSFQALVRQAQSAGITVLGYVSTVDGQRPIDQVEADAQHYRAWYGVTGIFLDRVSGQAAQFGYYGQISAFIHTLDGPSSVWMNPGLFPDQDYMSIGDVVMVFEGTYAQYAGSQLPRWARDYPATRFAFSIYDTPAADLGNALRLASARHADHIYVTDGTGGNPYQALPSYWSNEVSLAASGCGS